MEGSGQRSGQAQRPEAGPSPGGGRRSAGSEGLLRIIAGRWKGHRLKTVRGRNVRPTTDRVREAWFSALGDRVVDARVVDLFAGSGALGLEAASRGAAEVVLVERARSPAAVISANIGTLGAHDICSLINDDVFRFLGRVSVPFDLALADPPYETGDAARLVERWIESPFA
ncbi:MAG: 16S rRNA (guanine(966)-N(2))-methyltransferase RsmD, partial [Gemmatimonadota bacterium]|nr:16S rRNA (guanine(966)-N(2))-methyltransferase RsmD [Gemmatimonadota bacterium]